MNSKYKKVILITSLTIYTLSLCSPAITSNELEDKTLYGIATLVMGGLSFLGGGILEWLIWLANPLYLLGIILYLKSKNIAKYFSLLSVLIAISFVFWDSILVSESGRLGKIETLEYGYWLWIFGLLTLTIGSFFFLKENNKSQ